MPRRPFITLAALAAAAATGLAPLAARAQAAWPERAIHVVLPFPPGGPSDIVMRLAAEKMLVALAVSGGRRSPTLPDVPTIAEAGVAGYAADFSLVMFAPRAVPEAVVTRFRQAFVDALNAPDVVAKLKAGDQTVVASTPVQAAAVLAADARKWGEVARRIQLGLD